MAPPTDEAIIHRLRTEAITWVNAVALQSGRLNRRSGGDEFKFSGALDLNIITADLHFLVVALTRLRRCIVRAGNRVDALRDPLGGEVHRFDSVVPWLQKVRNVAEHIDEYNLDEGRDVSVRRVQVQTWSLDKAPDGGLVWGWLGETIDIEVADGAGVRLYRQFQAITSAWLATTQDGASGHDAAPTR